ncbi:MAG: flagellar biosynthesis protein FlhF [Phycisphaerales bacterium]|nr:flagellar biosynthesis protein FlhF [Phycisphaerales bacterium]
MASTMLKTYRAPSMAQALTEVKKDLGADAVILHTRTFKVGGVLGIGARSMVEITASPDVPGLRVRRLRTDQPDAVPRRPNPASQQSSQADGRVPPAPPQTQTRFQPDPQVQSRGPAAPRPEFAPAFQQAFTAPQANLADPIAPDSDFEPDPALPGAAARVERTTGRMVPRSRVEQVQRAKREFSGAGWSGASNQPRAVALAEPPQHPDQPNERQAVYARPETIDRLATRAPIAPIDDAARAVIHDELASIKKMMGQVLRCSRQAAARPAGAPPSLTPSGFGPMSDPLFDCYMSLVEQEVAAELAEDIIGEVRDELHAGEQRDATIVRETVLRRLAIRLPVAGEPQSAADGPLTVALIGPTGVGKTTTLAKLAATYKLRRARRVGLITCDTYRIAAVEQLRTYADIIGLPLRVASGPDEMAAARRALADCDVVLIDTPGRSQHDQDRLGELSELLEAAKADEVHLVLSSAASESVLARTTERFLPLGPQRVVLTKLDEAVSFGFIPSVCKRSGLPLSFVTTGQEVPDHIETARSERLARLVLDGGPVRSGRSDLPADHRSPRAQSA